jgi:acetylornithine aminotransferase/acetylornithine/N-succinyldiaminopimelate aminotransferase
MNLQEIKKIDKENFMGVYSSRMDVCFDHGEGCYLYDLDGKEYIDAFAGIAVNCLGYNHPKLTDTICEISKKVIHCSNVFYIKEQAMLEKKLCEISFADKVFFANSGSEANEGAVKLARRYFKNKGENKYKVISLNKSFHGRTLAMVAATGQEKYQKPYAPLPSGFINVPPQDINVLKNAINSETCAVMMELVQGEGGIITMDTEYVKEVRKLCDENNILLIFDEVQTGIGRTGMMFAYEHYGIKPDIMTLAKALGGGIPIGAILATDKASAFIPGDHGTTFGGNALSCGAAYTVLNTIEQENILENVNTVGEYFKQKLEELSTKYGIIEEVRGIGLMLGLVIKDTSKLSSIKKIILEKGFVIGTAGGVALRFVPPLIFKKCHVDNLIDVLNQTFKEIE